MSIPSPAVVHSEPVSDQVQVIDLGRICSVVQMWTDGDADIFVTLDGSVPAIDAPNTLKIKGGAAWQSPPGLNTESIRFIGTAVSGRLSLVAI